jgi:hypothetical protein
MLHSQETRIDPANLSYSHALNAPWAVDCSTQWDFDSRKTNHKKFRDWAAEPQSEKSAVPSCSAWEKSVAVYPRSGFRDGIPGPEHRITHMKFAFDFLAVHEREGAKNYHCDEQEGVIRMERPGDAGTLAGTGQITAFNSCFRRFSVICRRGREVETLEGGSWGINPNEPPYQMIIFETSSHNTTDLNLSVDWYFGVCDPDKHGLKVAETMLNKVFDHLTASWVQVLELSTSHTRLLVSPL